MKLKSKVTLPYKGEVIDLCVSNSHSYNVENVAVHNSGGGSLVAYVLYITDLDPLKWDLPFARFLSIYRLGAPDIDCIDARHLVVMHDGSMKRAGDIAIGDKVTSGTGVSRTVTAAYARGRRVDEVPLCIVVKASDGTLGNVHVVPNHKFVKVDGSIVRAHELAIGDVLMASTDVVVASIVSSDAVDATFVDVTVEGDHTFKLVPFDVIVLDDAVHLTMGYVDEVG